MKTLTRIFVAVAALFAVSCTTDATEDLGVKLDANGQTELALSLNESRTHLGEKAGDVYPLYWSEGDKIAVNGIVSEALAADALQAVGQGDGGQAGTAIKRTGADGAYAVRQGNRDQV